LVRAGSGGLTLGIPDSEGIPPEIAGLTAVARFNDLASVEEILAAHGGDVAAVIVEPVAGNMGTVLPEPGFLEGLRNLATKNGALLVFDEVITGFRVGWGGAQARFGVSPDLTCLGKIVGGGLPLAAIAGPRLIMERLAPCGGVYEAGTLSGNPIAVAAGLATLRELAAGTAYTRLEELGRLLEGNLKSVQGQLSKPICLNRCGSMFTVFLGIERVRSFEDAVEADTTAFARFFHALLERGIYVAPSQFEAGFISLAHTEADVTQFTTAVADSLAEVL
jgi:glutamate-1-semialdehyde 2,1-aminomutase